MVLFAQVSCTQSKETLMNKRIWGIVSVCIGMIIALTYRAAILYLKNMDIFNEKLFDANTISAEDYSIYMEVTKEMTDAFEAEYNKKYDGQAVKPSFIQSYEDDLSNSIIQQLGDKCFVQDEKDRKIVKL